MNKSTTAVIAVLVVIIVVIIGLNYTGLLKLPSQNNTTNSNTSNVVSSSEVSTSLGGNWTQTSTGHGTSGNVSTFLNVLSSGTTPFTSAQPSNAYVATPAAIGVASPSQPFENISSFEFSVYSPNHAGFAAVGYATFGSTTYANDTFNMIYSNVTASNYTNQFNTKGNVSGHPYAYTWTYLNNTTLTPADQNESLLIGIYGNNIIGIYYLTPDNLSVSSFTSLYLAQISKMSSMATLPALSEFVSGTNVSSNIGNSWHESLGIDVKISNATSILHEFLGSAVTSANISTVDMSILNQTAGNLSEIGIQGYTAGTSNASSIGFAKFLNDKVSYLVYTTAEASVGNSPNATTGTISSDNVSYVYFHESAPGYYFNQTINSPAYNVSVLFAVYGDYVIYQAYIGTSAITQTQFVNLLQAEVSLL